METYCNPVWPHAFPDPFVLKHEGEYWAYCTGFWHDGRCFGVLHSRDLVHWEPRAGAMAPLPPPLDTATCYWAPEVARHAGRFYLYYSVGNEETMEIRVAVADHPAGPFVDAGRRLTAEPFAIDAHVFAAADGSRWLFYATDFLERSHVGTGTVRDRLLDPFTLAGAPRPVTLPRYDWHVYDPRRPEKGNVRWHTVEGSFVLERKGVLYQMFSAGNWQNPTYGVSYATSRDIAGLDEWEQAADGDRVLPILRTVRGPEGDVVGPGHNSVVRGPDGRQLFCVYHRWSDSAGARVMAIDRLDWAGERMILLGPTTTPQPAPLQPWMTTGWEDLFEADGGRLHLCPEKGSGEIVRIAHGPDFTACELVVNVRLAGEGGALIYPALAAEDGPEVALSRTGGGWSLTVSDAAGSRTTPIPPAFDPFFDPDVDQQLRFWREGERIDISWEGRPLGTASAPAGPARVGLGATGHGVSFEMVRVSGDSGM
jgi:beta-xylosidase